MNEPKPEPSTKNLLHDVLSGVAFDLGEITAMVNGLAAFVQTLDTGKALAADRFPDVMSVDSGLLHTLSALQASPPESMRRAVALDPPSWSMLGTLITALQRRVDVMRQTAAAIATHAEKAAA